MSKCFVIIMTSSRSSGGQGHMEVNVNLAGISIARIHVNSGVQLKATPYIVQRNDNISDAANAIYPTVILPKQPSLRLKH